LRFGMGRGLARREFEAFRGTMDESRERFDEASSMIVNALRNGFMEGEGRFYKQPKVAIRPRPHYSFDGRLYAVASSEDSVASAARLGAHMVLFSDRPWPMRLPAIARHRALFQQCHGVPAPPLMITDFCLCGPSVSEAEEHARRYMGTFVESNFHHYEFLGDHFAQVKGYDAYAQKAAIAKQSGLGGAIDGFMQAAIWGTPDRILRALEARREVVGDFELNVAFRFGGVPYAIAERGLRLFAHEVLPVLKTWTAVEAAEAAP
jgi:alkanesulfonate monooxygenase SsuD/methylene tetrahydromethanopterin reductase-like flavin-dependent oxidoreductase (luciferase family)